jgi:hypothetical protein
MSGKRRRLNKKERERLEQEIAQRESDARSESEDRQQRIKLLWDLKEQDLKGKTYEQRKLKEQKLKEQKLKTLQSCIKLLAPEEELEEIVRELLERAELKDHGLLPWLDICKLVGEVVDLAHLQDREIDYLMQFRRDLERIRAYYPEKVENLSSASLFAEMQPLIEQKLAEENPKKEWERKRGRYRRLIEYEFGGEAEANLRKSSLFGLSGLPYQPSCLDDILRGGVGEVKMQPSFWGPPIAVDTVTNMRRLQDLFGMYRDRFPKELRGRRMGTKIVYDWCAVVKIMDALLSERRGPRKRSVPGRPRTLWLSDPDLCNRVLSGIEARVNSISPSKQIATAFLDLVRRHRVDSAKK